MGKLVKELIMNIPKKNEWWQMKFSGCLNSTDLQSVPCSMVANQNGIKRFS